MNCGTLVCPLYKLPQPHNKPTGTDRRENMEGRGECKFTSIRLLAKVLGNLISHRGHRFYRTFQHTFRGHKRPSADRGHRAFTLLLAVISVTSHALTDLCETLPVNKRLRLSVREITEATPIRLPTKEDRRLDR